MDETLKQIEELEKEKRSILMTAQFVSVRVTDDFKDKKERDDVMYRLQQWRRQRVQEIDKEIQELKVKVIPKAPKEKKAGELKTETEADAEPAKIDRLPTPHSSVADPDPLSLFRDSPKLPGIKEQVTVFKTPVACQPPLSSMSCMGCPGCGTADVWQCTCTDKQWIKDYTVS
jgi:hypothetical protein